MSTDASTPTASNKLRWAGYIVSALPVLALLFSASMKIANQDFVVEEFARLGYTDEVVVAIGIVELVCTLLYIAPQTAVLGAILLTGYLGGATATHVRLAEVFAGPVVMGILIWLGLYLREPRLRALLPWRTR
jgi:DoxX-like family